MKKKSSANAVGGMNKLGSFQTEWARFLAEFPSGSSIQAFYAGASAALVLRAERASLGRDESKRALEKLYSEINQFSFQNR